MEVKVIGQMDNTIDHTFESANRVYDVGGCAPTMNTCGGGGLQPKILVEPKCLNPKGGRAGVKGLQPSLQDRVYSPDSVSIAVTTAFMPSILENNGNICIGGLQEHQTPRTDGISPSLTAAMGMGGGQTPLINYQYKIRKLTPLECWRLMDFSDEDFEKASEVNSNTQLYKQAGNSIVKNVLVAILGQMIPEKEDIYKEVQNEPRRNKEDNSDNG